MDKKNTWLALKEIAKYPCRRDHSCCYPARLKLLTKLCSDKKHKAFNDWWILEFHSPPTYTTNEEYEAASTSKSIYSNRYERLNRLQYYFDHESFHKKT